MRPTVRKLLVFGVKLILILILFALVWPYFAPTYNLLVATAAARLAPTLTNMPIEVQVEGVTADLIKLNLHFPRQRMKIEYEYEGYFHFNLGLLLALFAATPFLKLARTMRLVLIAVGFLVIFHILFLVTSSTVVDPCVRGAFHCPRETWYRWLDRLMAVSKNLFPVFLWALMTFRYWFPKPITSPLAPAPQPHKKHRAKEARP